MNWFAQPLGLIALAALPAVLILHLYRQRHRKTPVSTLFLWVDPESRDSSGITRRPLRKTPSFWLEMLAALLLALFLSGFQPFGNSEAAHLVVVLDDSASMGAMDPSDPEQSPRARAIAHLEETFEHHGRRTRVTLIRSGNHPRLLAGPGAMLPEARQALETWKPEAAHHAPRIALQFAREFSAGEEVLFLTDHAPNEALSLGEEVRVQSFGSSHDNAALLDARRFYRDGREYVTCTVRSFASLRQERTVTIWMDGQAILERAFSLGADQETHLEFPLDLAVGTVELRLDEDALATDNRLRLYPNPDRRVRVAVGLEDAARDALRLTDLLNALEQVELTDRVAEAHLFLGHEAATPPTWTLQLPRDPEESSGAEAFLTGFLPEKRHPLMEGLTLQGVVWTRAVDFEPLGIPVVSIGDQAILTEASRQGAAWYQWNLLPQRSTFPQSPDWPILMSNLVAQRSIALPGPRATNLVAGQAFEFVLEGEKDLTLQWDAEERPMYADGLLKLEDLPPHPEYILREGDTILTRFAVNFADPIESDLRQAEEAERSPVRSAAATAHQAFAASPFGRLLLLLLLGVIAADWWILSREGRA
ncbi:MAG: vWA domain-containing protein [Planctomycetota bacterium]